MAIEKGQSTYPEIMSPPDAQDTERRQIKERQTKHKQYNTEN